MSSLRRHTMKNSFNSDLRLLLTCKLKGSQYMTRANYLHTRNRVGLAKNKKDDERTLKEDKLLRKYDLIKVGNVMRLIAPVKSREESVRYYVHTQELFSILHKIHMNTNHGSREVMMSILQQKYANISSEIVEIYLKLCARCEKRKISRSRRKFSHTRFARESEKIESKGEFGILTMTAYPDHPYRYILMYQDLATKLIALRPLRTMYVTEVASTLLDMFCTFGSPNVLRSINGRETAEIIVEEIRRVCPDAKIVHARSEPFSLEQEKISLGEMLYAWMSGLNTHKWSEGLRFVQVMLNETQSDEIDTSPFKAMFGRNFKLGLNWSPLPEEVVARIKTEEELLWEVDKLIINEDNI